MKFLKKIYDFFESLTPKTKKTLAISGIAVGLALAIGLSAIFTLPIIAPDAFSAWGQVSSRAEATGSMGSMQVSSTDFFDEIGEGQTGKLLPDSNPATSSAVVNDMSYYWPDIMPSTELVGTPFNTLGSAPSSGDDISKFLLTTSANSTLPFNVACNVNDNVITALLPAGVNIGNMKVTVEHNGRSLTYYGEEVKSNSTAFNFSVPVELKFTDKDGNTVSYMVYIRTIDSGIPSISVKTNDFRGIENKTSYADCSVVVAGGDKSVASYSSTTRLSATAKIKGRGWSSWYNYPKKSYSLTFDASQKIFDLPAGDEWVLAANFADRTLMRNALANEVATTIGSESVMKLRYVDLWVNGEYMGTYQIIQRIKIDKSNVNITSFDPNKNPDQVGYILETNGHNSKEEFETFTNGQDTDRPNSWRSFTNYATYDPLSGDIFWQSKTFTKNNSNGIIWNLNKPSDNMLNSIPNKATEFVDYIYDKLNTLESAILNTNETVVNNMFDMQAAAKWYIVEEMAMNTDSGMHCSVYMYKDAGQKFKMGPIWDFDLGWGNGLYANMDHVNNTYLDNNPNWWNKITTMRTFRSAVKQIWNRNRDTLLILGSFITEQQQMLERAMVYNFDKWPITLAAEHCNPQTTTVIDNYPEQVSYLSDFYNQRFNYMDSKISTW